METNESEEWRVIPSFPDYEASSWGRIRRCKPALKNPKIGHILSSQTHKNGYLHTTVCRDRKRFVKLTHSLIAEAFIGPRPMKHDINHKDMDRHNNRADNLEYCSRTENLLQAYRMTGGHNGVRKKIAKLTEEQVHAIRRLRAAGHTLEAIAEKVGTNSGCVRTVVYKKAWTWLSTPDDVANAGDVLRCDFAMQRDA